MRIDALEASGAISEQVRMGLQNQEILLSSLLKHFCGSGEFLCGGWVLEMYDL